LEVPEIGLIVLDGRHRLTAAMGLQQQILCRICRFKTPSKELEYKALEAIKRQALVRISEALRI